ncbi:MAG TPA: hypothetical protein VFE47_22055 [Tepidisphaeraceae bacterium]|jgi:hypothetical protein|nr:hypothetical protein [Tepidisphaeraceae bacterium]
MRRLLASSVLAVGLTFGAVTTSAPANATRTQLNQTLPEVQFNGVALNDAIDFLRDVSGANIAVNWKALEEAGVTKDTPINVRLRAVSMKKALQMVLTEAGGGDKLGYDVDGNVISITTKELVDSKMYTRVYSILDLITEIPDFTDAPDISLNTTSNNQQQNPQGGGQIGASGQGQGQSQGPFGSNNVGDKTPPKSREDRAKDLVDLIVAIIQPDVWQDNGGKASIRYFNGSIIVTAPRSVQEAIGGVWN